MKTLFLSCLIVAGITTAHAQGASGNAYNNWEEKNREQRPEKPTDLNDFVAVDMISKDGIAIFEGMPAMKKPVYAMLTNADGIYIRQARITPELNYLNIRRLKHGLYFITIIYKNRSKKAFPLNL